MVLGYSLRFKVWIVDAGRDREIPLHIPYNRLLQE
jgi:hypothetical protein